MESTEPPLIEKDGISTSTEGKKFLHLFTDYLYELLTANPLNLPLQLTYGIQKWWEQLIL